MPRMTGKEKRRLTQQSAAEVILWAALEKVAKSEYDRAELAAGKHDVALMISAEVDGTPVETDLSCKVNIQGGGVYHPTVKAPADHLLAILWSHLPASVRLRLAIDLPETYQATKTLPDVDEAHLIDIRKLTKRLTARGPAKPKAGSITATRT